MLTELTQATSSGWKVRYSKRSRYGVFSWWFDFADHVFGTDTKFIVAGHGGNGSNQGDLEWNNDILLDFVNRGYVVISYDYNSAGFYVPTANDPRGTTFPDTLLEHVELFSFLDRNYANSAIWGSVGRELTRDPAKRTAFGLSHTAWVLPFIMLAPRIELPSGYSSFGHEKYNLSGDSWRFNNCVAYEGHMMMSDFSMIPNAVDVVDWVIASAASVGATSIVVTSGSGTIAPGLRMTIAGDSSTYLVTNVAGTTLTITPALTYAVSGGEAVGFGDLGLGKWADNGYSWAGATAFGSYSGFTWDTLPLSFKRQMDVARFVYDGNPRLDETHLMMACPQAGGDAFITNDATAGSGWRDVFTRTGPNLRYANLHSPGPSFAIAGMLADLGYVEGQDYLLRAGGPKSNPDVATRFNSSNIVSDISGFMISLGL